MKLETYRSPLGTLQQSSSYLKIERAIKNPKIERTQKKERTTKIVRKNRKPQNREKKKKQKIIGGIKKSVWGSLK